MIQTHVSRKSNMADDGHTVTFDAGIDCNSTVACHGVYLEADGDDVLSEWCRLGCGWIAPLHMK